MNIEIDTLNYIKKYELYTKSNIVLPTVIDIDLPTNRYKLGHFKPGSSIKDNIYLPRMKSYFIFSIGAGLLIPKWREYKSLFDTLDTINFIFKDFHYNIFLPYGVVDFNSEVYMTIPRNCKDYKGCISTIIT